MVKPEDIQLLPTLPMAYYAGVFKPSISPAYVFTVRNVIGSHHSKDKKMFLFETAQFVRHNPNDARLLWQVKGSWKDSLDIKQINTGEFLSQFAYIEAITLHLLALKEAGSLDQYFQLQLIVSRISLAERLKLTSNSTQGTIKKAIRRLNDVLEVRNQVVHNVDPVFIKIAKKWHNYKDPELVNEIKDTMLNGMEALVNEYLVEQEKLSIWLIDIEASTPNTVQAKNKKGEVTMTWRKETER